MEDSGVDDAYRNGRIMKWSLWSVLVFLTVFFGGSFFVETVEAQTLRYHALVVDGQNKILPWYSPASNAYDTYLDQLWTWLPTVPNGPSSSLPMYYLYCGFRPGNPITADSWENDWGERIPNFVEFGRLYYAYTGNRGPLDIAKNMADYALMHGMTPSNYSWPNFPYGTDNAGDTELDGDNVVWNRYDVLTDLGSDMGMSFYKLYLVYGTPAYRTAAINIADVLASKIQPGSATNSPWPYVVNAQTGATRSRYTSNFAGALTLFDLLIEYEEPNASAYTTARQTLKNWILQYPMQSGNWVDGHSDVFIDGNTNWSNTTKSNMNLYLLDNPSFDPNFETDVPRLLQWTEDNMVNVNTPDGVPGQYYGASVVAEQFAYMWRMGYQTSRQAAEYAGWYAVTGNEAYKDKAYRGFNYSTYMMKANGESSDGPTDGVGYWWGDAYGEGPRMFFYGFMAVPEWAPPRENHILYSRSVLKNITYASERVQYTVADNQGKEYIRLAFFPGAISAGGTGLSLRNDLNAEGYTVRDLGGGDYAVAIRRERSGDVVVSSVLDTESPILPANFNLAASSTSQSSVAVSWNPATDNVGVTGYIVERCEGMGCSTFTQVGTPTASPFVDSGLAASTFYNYHVRAKDAAGNFSDWSNVVGATTEAPDTQAPTAPTNLSATASSSAINLTWTASTDNVAVTGYRVERCSGSGCTNFSEITSQPATSYQDAGLTASTLYRYQVRATDGAGNNSGYSTIAQATTAVAPLTPTFISEYETAWNSATSPKTTTNFSVQTGDTLVAYAVNESSSATIATPPTGTLAGTWTLRQTISASGYTYLRLWTMQVAGNQTNVNVSFTNAGGNFGGDVLHFRNTSGIGVTAQGNAATGNPTLTLNGVGDNSAIVMVNGDWSAKTGARTYNTSQAGAFTETSAFADGSSYGVEAGYYGNAGTSGNKTVGLTAPTGMTWALAAIEIKGNSTPPLTLTPCNTVTTANFSQSIYDSYGAPYDVFKANTPVVDLQCSSGDLHTMRMTTGIPGDTAHIAYTKGYYYDKSISNWTLVTGTCVGAVNGEWCQGAVSSTITNPNISTASASDPVYFVGMVCSVQSGAWKCGCRDATCNNFYWQIQGAGQ